jgi:hypothetical protein
LSRGFGNLRRGWRFACPTPRAWLPLACALALLPAPPRAHAADSLAVRTEFGVTGDASNEFYYEYAYTDTTFLGRRLRSTPEARAAGVAALEVAGRSGALEYSLRPELTLGNEVTRAASALLLRVRQAGGWRLSLEPRAEYLRDRGFGVERRQTLLAGTARARRFLGAGAEDALDLRLGGDILDTPRSTDPFLLAHRVATAGVGWDHEPLLGTSWSGRYQATVRTFPDSAARDHVEHRLEGTVRQDFEGGNALGLDAEIARRGTLRGVSESRDRFAELRAELRGTVRLGEQYALRGSAEAEFHRYDQPDSVLDFDYGVERFRLTLQRELPAGLTFSLGPRAELLSAPWSPTERYAELGAAAGFELLSRARWWSLEPGAGRRTYTNSESGGTTDPAALHSSYTFVELRLLADQGLPGKLRLRVTLDGRLELHDDPSQDSRGFYFSMDLRRLH